MITYLLKRIDDFNSSQDKPSEVFVVDVPEELVPLVDSISFSWYGPGPYWEIERVKKLQGIEEMIALGDMPKRGIQEISTQRANDLQPYFQQEFPIDRNQPIPEVIRAMVFYSLHGKKPRMVPHFVQTDGFE